MICPYLTIIGARAAEHRIISAQTVAGNRKSIARVLSTNQTDDFGILKKHLDGRMNSPDVTAATAAKYSLCGVRPGEKCGCGMRVLGIG
jgi:hypothetical protein